MSYVSIKPVNLGGALGPIIGKAQAELESKVELELDKVIDRFLIDTNLPAASEIDRIKTVKNNLQTRLQKTARTVQKIEVMPAKVRQTATAIKNVITLLEVLPLPTSVPPGIGIPVGVTNKFAALLHKMKEFAKSIEESATGVEAVLSINGGVSKQVLALQDKLNKLDDVLQIAEVDAALRLLDRADRLKSGAVEEDEDGNEIYLTSRLVPILIKGDKKAATELISKIKIDLGIKPPSNPEGFAPNTKYTHRGPNGIVYRLAIIEDTKSPSIAKRRYAVAMDSSGVVMLKGQPSFSSSEDVLLDEIKFRIDYQLP